MKTARFLAAARLEFLAEVIYYNNAQLGLGARFAAAIEEATARAVAFPASVWPPAVAHGVCGVTVAPGRGACIDRSNHAFNTDAAQARRRLTQSLALMKKASARTH